MNDRFYTCAKALVATVRAGSISAAANELQTTKSAISQKITFFEAELGLTLLDRSGRAVTPTAAGRRIFDLCVGPVDAAMETAANLGLLKSGAVAGRVSISGPNSLLGTVFVPLLAGLRTSYPDIDLELHADDSKTDFAADDIDLAFRSGPASKGKYVSATLPSAQRALYASPAFLELTGPITKLSDLANAPCVLRIQEDPEWAFQHADGRRQSVVPCVGLRVNTMELSHAAVQEGHGAALLPSILTQPDVHKKTLVRLLPDWSTDPVDLSLLCRSQRLSAPPVAAVRRYILENCTLTA
ncbi:LysR family transcriptional regulator [uncultured Roseovarius sp.]|uniref:LysR family transcriptional regulator n=1 Tax=uncultured Roseovarius sp. TaxID=293344 RepID=UPI00260349D0|nr:LysR family transcriptional regulator [uncultured Roseovarius sp.]